MTAKQTPICPNCGSTDISKDATARWCDETQAWTLSTTFDDTTCDDCGQETNNPDWIDASRPDSSIYIFGITHLSGALDRGWWVRHAGGLIGPLAGQEAAETERGKIETARDRLFKCCRDNMAPDWSRFSILRIGGCRHERDAADDGWIIVGGCSTETTEFWTVYALDKDECSEAITDCESRSDADQVANELSKLSGLEIAP